MELLINCMKRRFSMLRALCITVFCCLTSMLETNESQLILLNFFYELISKSMPNYTKHYATCTEQYNIFRFVMFNICCQYSKKKSIAIFYGQNHLSSNGYANSNMCVQYTRNTRAMHTLCSKQLICKRPKKCLVAARCYGSCETRA